MLTKVATSKAPAAIGPYSQGMIANGFLFASGQIPIVPETGMIAEGDITVQAQQVMKNVGEVLKEAEPIMKMWLKPLVFWLKCLILPHSTVFMKSILRESLPEAALP